MMTDWHKLPLHEKVGQLFILAFPGEDPEKIIPLVKKYQIGGCYISQDNAKTFQQAKKMTETIQHHANIPLLMGVDQEGAWGVLVPHSITGPGNLSLGVGNNVDLTYKMYGVFAEEMGSVGYQVILGPCADVNLNPHNPIIGTRSFGEHPDKVSNHVRAAVRGIKDHGGIATAKHFPGHGDTQQDTHREIPVVDKPIEELMKNEFMPFQAAIDAGVDMIMTSHIIFPQLDPDYPATLSKIILTDLLRKKMNFKGLVITDSMNMGAMRKNYTPAEAVLQALKAGSDLIMLSEEHYDHSQNYLDKQIQSIESIIDAVKNNHIPMEIINDRLARIFQFKEERIQEPVINLTQQEKMSIAEQAALSSIQVLKDKSNILPLKETMNIALVNATPQESYSRLMNSRGIGPNQQLPAFDTFSEELKKLFPKVQIFSFQDRQQAVNFDRIILVTEDYPLPGEDFDKTIQHQNISTMIKDFSSKLIVVGLRSSYELADFPDIPCYISSESSRTISARMAAIFLKK